MLVPIFCWRVVRNIMLSYQPQSLTQLKFYLLQSVQLPVRMRVLRAHVMTQRRYQLVLRIVGVSHAFSLHTAACGITEIVACADIEAAPSALIDMKPMHTTAAYRQDFGTLQYTIDWHIQRFSLPAFTAMARHLLMHAGETRLFYQFPPPTTPYAHAAFTCVDVSCRPERADIRTYHTYPEELGLVTTHTSIVLT